MHKITTLVIDFAEELVKYKNLLASLGGKTRIKILKLISNGQDWTISAMAKKMRCGIANLSQQVSELEKAGLIIKKLSPSAGNNVKYIRPVYDTIEIRLKPK